MRCLAAQPRGLSLTTIAHVVGLPRSTVQRIIAALEAEDMIEALTGSGYRLGPGFHQLVHQAHGDIISIAQTALQQLGDQLGETVALSCIRGQQSTVISRVISKHELQVVIPLGQSVPMHTTADGKVLLSTLSDEQIKQWLTSTPEKLTTHTLSLSALLKQMPDIRREGIAVDIEEHTLNVNAMSILIPTLMGSHAVSVIAPAVRFKRRRTEYRSALKTFKKHFMLLQSASTNEQSPPHWQVRISH